jgi:hypothetical protein
MSKSEHLVGYSHVYVGGWCMGLNRSLSPSKYLGGRSVRIFVGISFKSRRDYDL